MHEPTNIKFIMDWLSLQHHKAVEYLNLLDLGHTHDEAKRIVTLQEKSTVST